MNKTPASDAVESPEGDTIRQIEKILMNDDSKGVSKQNTIDNLLNEMHANAAEAVQEAEQS